MVCFRSNLTYAYVSLLDQFMALVRAEGGSKGDGGGAGGPGGEGSPGGVGEFAADEEESDISDGDDEDGSDNN